MRDVRKNQQAHILNLLVSARGDWVPSRKVVECAAQYNARIYELRRLGYQIVNRTEDIDEVRHSWFRLIPGEHPPGRDGIAPAERIGNEQGPAGPASVSFPEFGDLSPERYPD